jgi:hypothetical protein
MSDTLPAVSGHRGPCTFCGIKIVKFMATDIVKRTESFRNEANVSGGHSHSFKRGFRRRWYRLSEILSHPPLETPRTAVREAAITGRRVRFAKFEGNYLVVVAAAESTL